MILLIFGIIILLKMKIVSRCLSNPLKIKNVFETSVNISMFFEIQLVRFMMIQPQRLLQKITQKNLLQKFLDKKQILSFL